MGRLLPRASGRTSSRSPSTHSRRAARQGWARSALARMVPAAIALPFGGMLADRYARQRVLLGIYVVRALAARRDGSCAGGRELARACLRARGDWRRLSARPFGPQRCRSCRCWRAHRASSSRPTSPRARWKGSARWSAPRSAASSRRPRASRWPSPSRPRSTSPARCSSGASAARVTSAGARRRVERSLRQELLGGVSTLAREPHPRLIVLLFNSQTMVRGLLNVLLVVASIELLGMGESGVRLAERRARRRRPRRRARSCRPRRPAQARGHLRHRARALGPAHRARRRLAAGRLGARVSRHRRHRQRAARHLRLHAAPAHGGRARARARVRRLRDRLSPLAVAIGSLLGSVLVEQLGIRSALVVAGAILPVPCPRVATRAEADRRLGGGARSASWSSCRRSRSSPRCRRRRSSGSPPVSSDSTSPPGRRSSRRARPAIASTSSRSGEIDVVLDGVTMSTLGAGEYFGEIALLHDVPRTATCTARTDAEIYALGRDVFVAAVSGDGARRRRRRAS